MHSPEITIFDMLRIKAVSLPITIGSLWMIYPPLVNVKYEELSKLLKLRGKYNNLLFFRFTFRKKVKGERSSSFSTGYLLLTFS